MGFDPISLALSKNYTAETVEGMGAIKGDPGPQGPSGPPGPDGNDGFSPKVSVTDITGGHRVTITDADGPQSFDVMDGQGGSGGGAPDLTAGDGIAIEENTVSVTNPVRGILTQAEFDSLPEAQRASGTYFVDDGQGGSCGEVYDDQERVIGTWFGKPLYRKSFNATSPATLNNWATWIPIPDLDAVVEISIFVQQSAATNSFYAVLNGMSASVGYLMNVGIQVYNTIQDWAGKPVYAIAKYTKTTDEGVSE